VNLVGILFRPGGDAARALAQEVAGRIGAGGGSTWVTSPLDEDTIARRLPETDLLICVGGDGTVLSAARSVAPLSVPILGINMGRLGFLCELAPDEVAGRLPEILLGRFRLEELSMLRAELPAQDGGPGVDLHAMNDVTIGRGAVARPVSLSLEIDAVHVFNVRADGIIVATATGSTGYNLSAGGPVLPPASREIIVTAVAPHLSRVRPLVLPGESILTIVVESDHEAILSVDGQVNRAMPSGGAIQVQCSPYRAHLVRLGSAADFYSRLNRYLDLGVPD
jgi:NAD+ kinase